MGSCPWPVPPPPPGKKRNKKKKYLELIMQPEKKSSAFFFKLVSIPAAGTQMCPKGQQHLLCPNSVFHIAITCRGVGIDHAAVCASFAICQIALQVLHFLWPGEKEVAANWGGLLLSDTIRPL